MYRLHPHMEITASTSTDTRDAAVRVHTAVTACYLLVAWTGPQDPVDEKQRRYAIVDTKDHLR